MIAGFAGAFPITLGEFIRRAIDDYNVIYENTPPHRHLVRFAHGLKKIAYIQPKLQESDRLVSDVLRYLCTALEIPLDDFRFYLNP
jgi:hypothetical protein